MRCSEAGSTNARCFELATHPGHSRASPSTMPDVYTGDTTVNVSCKSGISAAVRPENFQRELFPVKDDLDLDARRMGIGVENLRRAERPQGEEDETEEEEEVDGAERPVKQNSLDCENEGKEGN